MSINLEKESAAVIRRLGSDGYSKYTIAEHRRCLDGFSKYLAETGQKISMNAAVNWLLSHKADWRHGTYKRYRRAIYRFEKYIKSGSIDSEPNCHHNYFAYYDANISYIKLPDGYKTLFSEFRAYLTSEYSKSTVNHYISTCTGFLLFISEKECSNLQELTIELPLEYLRLIRGTKRTDETKEKCVSGVTNILAYFGEQGYRPRCYSLTSSEWTNYACAIKLPNVSTGNAFQPSKRMEILADEFLLKLEEWRYSQAPRKAFSFIFNGFFLFLEINHIEYSAEASDMWLEHTPKDTLWTLRRKIIKWFDSYLKTGNIITNKVCRPILIDKLSDWSRNLINDYLELRRREGCANSTLQMCRSSCVRFFGFLERGGITNVNEITTALVKEFHNTDPHSTAESRNAYGSRIRKLLIYMAEKNLVPKNLYLSLSTEYARKYTVVSIMSPEMENAVYQYRAKSKSPNELRDTALVMLGLRMGLRASDVVSLKIDNIDWENRKISITQTKTGRTVSLPMPTDVGNSLYRYIKKGRPQSGISGERYVFLQHKAPFSKPSRRMCNNALNHILTEYGLKLPNNCGFHITRRTFATNLLRSRTAVNITRKKRQLVR